MPLPAHLVVFGPGMKQLAGVLPLPDLTIGNAGGSEIHEFTHQVYTIQKDFHYALLYGVDFIRRHEPLRVTKPIDSLSVPLLGYLKSGTFLPQVEVRWYEYDKKSRKEVEYFRMTLEHVRLNSIVTTLPDVKDPLKERYGHLETIAFCFQKITWLYKKGYLLYTDIWNGGFFTEEDEKDFSGKKNGADEAETTPDAAIISLFKVAFTEGTFVKPEKGFLFDKKAKVKFVSTVNRKPDPREGKVFAKLYAVYNGKTEDLRQVQEGRLREDGTWETEFTLRKPESYEKDKERKPDAQVEYYAEIENKYADGNFKSESVKVPEGEEEIVVPWFIDVHSHVQSTDCAPGPLVRGQFFDSSLAGKAALALKALPGFAGTPGVISKKTTEENAVELMKKSDAVLQEKKFDLMGDVKNRRRLIVNMPMDMDFGHWGGYEGKKIYERDESGYWVNGGEGRKSIKEKKYDRCVKYRQQLDEIQRHFKISEDGIVSLFHYDPRRWMFEQNDFAFFQGHWDSPFKFLFQCNSEDDIKKANEKYSNDFDPFNVFIFAGIGFKLYTALGYRPDDASFLPDLAKFYGKCSQPGLDIPIICHCSRGGMTTHEWRYYYKRLTPNIEFNDEEAKEWYTREFISPYAWEKVLQKFPTLKLCLAHFGGEECWGKQREKQKVDWFFKLIELMKSPKYPNVYVDLAYFLFDDCIIDQFAEAIKDEKVRRKILFGTDWYLMEMEWAKIGLLTTYKHYFERLFNGLRHKKLKAIDKTLPAKIMVLNTMKFLNLKQVAPKIDLLRRTLGKKDANLTAWVNEIPESADDFPRIFK